MKKSSFGGQSFAKRFLSFCLMGVIAVSAVLTGCGNMEDEEDTKKEGSGSKEENQLSLTELNHFDLDQVEQLDEYCVNGLELEVDYLTSFDVDRLLAGFRETAGLDMKGARRYDGWENSLIGGHSLGHYLTACAQAYVNTGVSREDKDKLYDIMTEIIDGLKECQDNSKGKSGYVFGATLPDKNNVEVQFDNVEKGLTNITTQAWVPWYTMHKIIAGVVDVYKMTGYDNALTVARGLGDWTYDRAAAWDSATRTRVLGIEYGGMNDCLYELYAVTGEEKYAVAAHVFDEEALFERILAGSADVLNNLHSNTTIPKILGALNRYVTVNGKTIDGETVDASRYLEYVESFWIMVTEKHTYITGGNGEWEHFGKDEVLDGERTNCNCETCSAYNMLKISRTLFQITGDRKYADYYENTFYNSILASQNPETGMSMYFQPMATGYFKVYGEPFNKFWCCTGSGMENFTKLNDSIYFYKDSTIYVNMYFSSKLTWEDKNVILTQSADIPVGNTAKFVVNAIDGKTADVNLRFRIPDWAAGDVAVTVNGKEYTPQTLDGYACVTGAFDDGDEIEVTIPMSVAVCTLPDNDTVLGFKYGPVVLSANLGTEDMKSTTTGVIVTVPAQKLVNDETIILPEGVSREDFIANINDYMVKDGDGLTFKLEGTELEFSPYYQVYNERYGIYWYFMTEEEKAAEDAAKARSTDVTIDTVQPGYGQYENDELHQMAETNTLGVTNDGTYRYAQEGGSFTYRMAVKKDGNNYLALTFRAEDNGKTILVKSGDTVLFSDTLDYIGLEDSYEVRVAIPADVVSRAAAVTANDESYDVIPVTFSGIGGAESARVCEFIYMLDVTPLYESDSKVAYFVDCGDYNTTTVSDGDAFGVYNSVTEQLYGYDPVTGKKWGLIDDANDQYGGSANNDGVYTAHTWCYEFNDGDGLPKESSNRYTKNQYEDGITERYLDYSFELPKGRYNIEIGFTNPWNCSNMHNVYANYGKADQVTLAENYNVSSGALKGTVSVTDGTMTLNFRNATASGLAINVTYIRTTFAD